jgi:ribosomal protein L37AE/L43A
MGARALDRGLLRADIQGMGERANLRRVAETRETCPSCGREAIRLATGHCVHCLQSLTGGGEAIETGRILRVAEFERARAERRRARSRKAARSTGAGLVGVIVGAALVGLFYLGMRWLLGFFGRGTAWRQ